MSENQGPGNSSPGSFRHQGKSFWDSQLLCILDMDDSRSLAVALIIPTHLASQSLSYAAWPLVKLGPYKMEICNMIHS